MGLAIIESGLRGAAMALFLLLAVFFARDWRRSLTARLGVLLTIGGACYVMLIAVDSHFGWDNPWRIPLHLISLGTPALFWPFAASWFDDDFELNWRHIALVFMTIAAGVVSNYLFFTLNYRAMILTFGWRGLCVASISLGLRATFSGWSADLVESRRRVRIALIIAVAIAILSIIFGELLTSGWPPPLQWRVMNAATTFMLAAVVALVTLGWRDPALLAAPVRPSAPPPRPEADDTVLLTRLDADMRHERLYRRDGLTITAVAARMGVPEYRLRRAINQGLGARNFNGFLNGFRLDEARQALADPDQRAVPILTIALDAGFGSLAPFNRAFREAHGCTPTAYRANALIGFEKSTG
jgi:AraC-like DNA-binding protein